MSFGPAGRGVTRAEGSERIPSAPPREPENPLAKHDLPRIPAGETRSRDSGPSEISSPTVAESGPRMGLLDRLYDPNHWKDRDGLIAAGARLFFRVCPHERSAWLAASVASFTSRMLASWAIPALSESRPLFALASYGIGVMVNWPIAYKLLRMQDKRECFDAGGGFDSDRYESGARRRFLFLPKQEIGALVSFGVSSAAILGLSFKFSALYGPLGGALIAVSSFVVQAALVNRYERIFARLGELISGRRNP